MANLDELRKRKAERVAKAQSEAESREIEELTLEEQYEEKLGRRGVEFEIVNTDVGCFVVKRPDAVVAKSFTSIASDKRGVEEAMRLVTPCVMHPERDSWLLVCQERQGIVWRCAAAVLAMYEASSVERSGKF